MSAPVTVLNNQGFAIHGLDAAYAAAQTTVTTAGTAVPLSSTATNKYSGVYIRALPTNSGNNMYIGDSTVSSTKGFILVKTDSNWLYLPVSNLKTVFVDAQTSGDKVCWIPV